MGSKTVLHDWHVSAGAKMVDFAGWDMPLHYGSQLEEHRCVRQRAGLFDVSHMGVVDVAGGEAGAFLRRLLANDVGRLEPTGQALYSCMLNHEGGVLDDLIVYARSDGRYRVVVNAGTREKDLAWMREQGAGFDVTLEERRDLALLAVQGPQARMLAHAALPAALREPAAALAAFHAAEQGDWFIGRTGYTGEDGFEVALPAGEAVAFADALRAAGVAPCGLGARDTLRLEAGMNLYGSDMDEQVTPFECGLAWTVVLEPDSREFIGRPALEAQRARGVPRRRVGLVLESGGVLRAHQQVYCDAGEGETTSGSFSPTLGVAIALARVPRGPTGEVEVQVRGKRLAVRLVQPPFVRMGRSRI